MGWFTNVKDWGKRIWSHDTSAAVGSYSYQTIAYAFEQIGVIPKVVNSIVNHVPTRTVAKHLMRITFEDLVPLVLVTFSNQYLQDRGKAYLDDDPDNAWLSTDTAIQTTLYLLQAATSVYSINKKTQIAVRTTIVSLEAPFLLNGVNGASIMTICKEERCSMLRFMQGSLRDIVAYWSTEAAISLIGYVPVAGGPLAAVLSVYHRGRYVLTVVLPDVCNRHQVIYLQKHSELALSLGLGQLGSSWIVNSLLETATGIPRAFYAGAVEQFMLVTQMSVAAHLNLPATQKLSKRALADPILLYQGGVGFMVDTILLGLKVKIPRMLQDRPSRNISEIIDSLPWASMYQFSELILHNKLAHIFLPSLLHDAKSFIQDPIVRSNWTGLRETIINVFTILEKIKNHPAVRASSYMPNVAGTLVEAYLGTPKFLTKLLLQLLTDEKFINKVRAWRSEVEKLKLEDPIPVSTEVSGQYRLYPAVDDSLEFEWHDLKVDSGLVNEQVAAVGIETEWHDLKEDSGPVIDQVAAAGIESEWYDLKSDEDAIGFMRHRFHSPKNRTIAAAEVNPEMGWYVVEETASPT